MQRPKSISDYLTLGAHEFADHPLRYSADTIVSGLKNYRDMAFFTGVGYLSEKTGLRLEHNWGMLAGLYAAFGYSFLPFVEKGKRMGAKSGKNLRNVFSVFLGHYYGINEGADLLYLGIFITKSLRLTHRMLPRTNRHGLKQTDE